jgi:hypothetical protein
MILISNFRCAVNVVFFLLGDSLASEFYVPTFWNTLSHLHRSRVNKKNNWDETERVFIQVKVWLKAWANQIPTHTNLYLHWNSHYHPANKQSVQASLMHRAKALCDQDSLTQESQFLTTISKENGYSLQQIWWALKPVTWTAMTNGRLTSIAFIPYTHTTHG